MGVELPWRDIDIDSNQIVECSYVSLNDTESARAQYFHLTLKTPI